ncbi:uncharacterized protein LOC134445372 [Engraulis encrasicolus]|uniref:uncharacterized protein LOC134445372 n=1 Tax=Engraulis encrasicolus TaxID=184585 RepID=UPI002FD2B914
MVRRLFLCFILLGFSVSTNSGNQRNEKEIRKINSIEELADNNIDFGKRIPRHGLLLLFWLSRPANIEIDQNDVIQLLNIDPSQGDYGFHYYGNYEKTLPSDRKYSYYTLGNLNSDKFPGSLDLPSYVTQYYRSNYPYNLRNMDRVVVQAYRNTPSRVRSVFISVHYDNFMEITPQLLREIQSIQTWEEFLELAGFDFNTGDDHHRWRRRDHDDRDGGPPGGGTVEQKRSSKNDKTHTETKHEGSSNAQPNTNKNGAKKGHQHYNGPFQYIMMAPLSLISSLLSFVVSVITFPFSLILAAMKFLGLVITSLLSFICTIISSFFHFLISVIILYPSSYIAYAVQCLYVVLLHLLSAICTIVYLVVIGMCIACLVNYYITPSRPVTPPSHAPRPQILVSQ